MPGVEQEEKLQSFNKLFLKNVFNKCNIDGCRQYGIECKFVCLVILITGTKHHT